MRKHTVLIGMLAGSLCAGTAFAQHKAPKDQPAQASEAPAPAGDALVLGTARIPKGVTADGKPLPAGTYQVRLTAQETPAAVGITEKLERWVEFVQGGSVKGREVASIVPASEAKLVAKDAPPAANAVKVQMLKGNEYMRLWFNKGGNLYLVHLPVAGATAGH